MRLFLLILLASLSSFCFGQEDSLLSKSDFWGVYTTDCKSDTLIIQSDCTKKKIYEYFNSEFKYPYENSNQQGYVHVFFVIDENGKVEQVEILKGLSNDIDNEVMRVIYGLESLGLKVIEGKKITYKIPFKVRLI